MTCVGSRIIFFDKFGHTQITGLKGRQLGLLPFDLGIYESFSSMLTLGKKVAFSDDIVALLWLVQTQDSQKL